MVNMYHIAICDDDKVVGAEIEKIILDYSKRQAVAVEVDIYSDGINLICEMERGEYYDLVFLDIEMKMKSGIEVGSHIRNIMHNEAIHIVYISSYSNYALKLFKIRPLDFLIKPFDSQAVIEDLEKSLELSAYEGYFFSWKKGWESKKVLVRDILYFCSRNKEVEIHLVDRIETFYGSLEKVYEDLKKWRFFYCHQSYLINYNQVDEFKYDQLIMKNGEIIGISQGKRKNVRAMLQAFDKEDM